MAVVSALASVGVVCGRVGGGEVGRWWWADEEEEVVAVAAVALAMVVVVRAVVCKSVSAYVQLWSWRRRRWWLWRR